MVFTVIFIIFQQNIISYFFSFDFGLKASVEVWNESDLEITEVLSQEERLA